MSTCDESQPYATGGLSIGSISFGSSGAAGCVHPAPMPKIDKPCTCDKASGAIEIKVSINDADVQRIADAVIKRLGRQLRGIA